MIEIVSFSSRIVTFAFPLIFVLGLTGNILSFITIVKGNRGKQSSFSVCVAALSIVDTFALITVVLYFWPRYALGVSFNILGVAVCKLAQFSGYISPCISQLITSMTIERLFVAYFPYKVRKWVVAKTGFIIVGAIVALGLMLFGHLLYGADLVQTAQNTTVCIITINDDSYVSFFPATKMIFPVTFLVMIFCNVAIIVKVIKSNAKVQPGTITTVLQTRKKQNRQMLAMVLLINVCCLIFNMPYIIYFIIQGQNIETKFDEAYFPDTNSTDELLSCTIGLSFELNFSLNFYLYVLSGSQFRKDLKSVLCF